MFLNDLICGYLRSQSAEAAIFVEKIWGKNKTAG
jgi:hypothetical protein